MGSSMSKRRRDDNFEDLSNPDEEQDLSSDGLSEDESEDASLSEDPWGSDPDSDFENDSWFSGDMVYGRGPGDEDCEEEVLLFDEDDFDDTFDEDFEVGLDDEYDDDLMAAFGTSDDESEDYSGDCGLSSEIDLGDDDDVPLPDDIPPFGEPT
ncbi:MAG: hypothetical protein PHE53_06180 [Thermoguttaceae bacterium]|nr:hypothetical protein [Thermoguttaceae bacterium]